MTPLWPLSPPTSPACPARTTPSTTRSPRLPSSVTDRWMEVTTPTPRLSARLSTSALLTELEVWPSTASSAPTGLSSTRTTSSATGGSTSTAPPQRISGVSMTRLLLRETPWQVTRLVTRLRLSTAQPPLQSETTPWLWRRQEGAGELGEGVAEAGGEEPAGETTGGGEL